MVDVDHDTKHIIDYDTKHYHKCSFAHLFRVKKVLREIRQGGKAHLSRVKYSTDTTIAFVCLRD